jgi:hypothetical protein
MKKIVLIVILITSNLPVFAQFNLSGQVLNPAKADTIRLNIPFVYGHYPDQDVRIAVNREGRFSFNLPVVEQKFGTLTFKGKRYLLLLSPGKNLTLSLNTADNLINKFTGTAASENKLLYRLDLMQTPVFRAPENVIKAVKLSPAAIQEQVVRPWLAARDKQLDLINRTSGLSKADKRLISQELKANAITQLSYFARNDMRFYCLYTRTSPRNQTYFLLAHCTLSLQTVMSVIWKLRHSRISSNMAMTLKDCSSIMEFHWIVLMS